MDDTPAGGAFPVTPTFTRIPPMSAFPWAATRGGHYWLGTGSTRSPASPTAEMLERRGVKLLWSSLDMPESNYLRDEASK
jgi:hypothetical protein